VVVFYLAHLLLPFRLSGFYDLILVRHPGFQNLVLPLILLSLGALALCFGSWRSRSFAFLAAWGVIMLVPMLNVTLMYNVENVHDRYLYLPSVAFCIMLACLLARLKETGAVRTALAMLAVIVAGYAFVTVRESQYWKNDFVLGERGLAMAPSHPVAPQLLGNAYIRKQRISEALPYLLDSLKLQPHNSDTLTSLGICYLEMNALPLADEFLNRAVKLDSSASKPHLLLGVLRLKQNRLDEAEAELRRGMALRRTPDDLPLFHYHLGNILASKNDEQGAIHEYLLALRNDPALDPAVDLARERLAAIRKQKQTLIPQQ
jgi:hypothetical protein